MTWQVALLVAFVALIDQMTRRWIWPQVLHAQLLVERLQWLERATWGNGGLRMAAAARH